MTGRQNVASQMRCERCKRFIGEDCLEGVDHSKGMQMDGDVGVLPGEALLIVADIVDRHAAEMGEAVLAAIAKKS